MKFGQRMREEMHEVFDDMMLEHSVDYKKLKKLISAMKKDLSEGKDIQMARVKWVQLLDAELTKFETFFEQRLEECIDSVKSVEETSADKRAVIKDLYLEVQELKFFGELNRIALRKILKKFDKNIPLATLTLTYQGRQNSLTSLRRHEELLECLDQLSTMYAKLQHNGNTKLAEMELDYHVSCISDLYACMLSHTRLDSKGEDGDAPILDSMSYVSE